MIYMKSNHLYNKINDLSISAFIAKENLGLQTIWIEARLSQIKKKLLPKKFKSVSKHLIRIK